MEIAKEILWWLKSRTQFLTRVDIHYEVMTESLHGVNVTKLTDLQIDTVANNCHECAW